MMENSFNKGIIEEALQRIIGEEVQIANGGSKFVGSSNSVLPCTIASIDWIAEAKITRKIG